MKGQEESVVTVQGRNGSINLYRDRLIIIKKKRSQWENESRNKAEILLDDLKHIHYLKPTDSIIGYIRFETHYNSAQLSNGLFMTAPIDNFTVVFSKQQEIAFDLLRIELCHLLDSHARFNTLKVVSNW